MKFTIDRERWCRGRADGGAKLLRKDDGTRCCLGFFLSACGIPDDQLRDVGEPNEVANNAHKPDTWPSEAAFLLEYLRDEDATEDDDQSCWAGRQPEQTLIDENDDIDLENDEREENIARIFARHGHEVTFINDGPDTTYDVSDVLGAGEESKP